MTVVRDQLFPQKPPGSRFRFSRTGVQPSPGSSTIELPSAFAESGVERLNRKYTKFDFTVDEGKEWLNPYREKN